MSDDGKPCDAAAARLVGAARYMTVATVGPAGAAGAGEPWVAPVAFWLPRHAGEAAPAGADDTVVSAPAERLAFFFASSPTSRHVLDIANADGGAATVAVSICDTSAPLGGGSGGVQFSGTAVVAADATALDETWLHALAGVAARFPQEEAVACVLRHKALFRRLGYVVVRVDPAAAPEDGHTHLHAPPAGTAAVFVSGWGDAGDGRRVASLDPRRVHVVPFGPAATA